MRFTASITVSCESGLWKISSNHDDKGRDCLPARLIALFRRFISSQVSIKQDSHLSVFISGRMSLDEDTRTSKPLVKLSQAPFPVASYLQKMTAFLRHLNCPRYSEREIDQRPAARSQPQRYFLAHLQSRWVLQMRFGSEREAIDADLYVLQVLHCLKHAPGINPLIGVVLDTDDVICAFLTELPAKGSVFNVILDAEENGSPVSWERRLKWCKQIITGVAHIHSNAFVVGVLWRTPEGRVAIDGNDNAVLFKGFSRTFPRSPNRVGVTPPEYSQLSSITSEIAATPETDIYHLGSILWRITEKRANLPNREDLQKLSVSDIRTADLIQLPELNPEIPQYFRDVIAACRSECPNERPAAWELLERLTAFEVEENVHSTIRREEPAMATASPVKQHLIRLEDCYERYDDAPTCDVCMKKAYDRYFHCEVCVRGDYHLCSKCFLLRELHCPDARHWLREYNGTWETEERYYSSIREETGKREIFLR